MHLSRKTLLTTIFSALSIIGYGIFVFAAAPTGGYVPGQTTDPACAPNSTDCIVQTGWDIDPQNSFLYTTTNKVGIGTNSPVTDLMVNGDVYLSGASAGFVMLDDAAALGFSLPPNTAVIGTFSSAGISDTFSNFYSGIPGGMYYLGINNGNYSHSLNLSGDNDGFDFGSANNNSLVQQNTTLKVSPGSVVISGNDNLTGASSYTEFTSSGNISINANGVGNGSSIYVQPTQVGMHLSTQSTSNDGGGTPLVIQVADENTRGGGFSARSRNLSYANAGADMFVWDQALGGDRTWIWMDESKIDTGLKLDQYFAGVTNYTTNNVNEMSFEFHNGDFGNPQTNSKFLIAEDFVWSKPMSFGTAMSLSGSTGDLSVYGNFTMGGQTLSIYGVTYNFPGSQGGSGTVLTNDGTGNITWNLPVVSVYNGNSLISTGLSNTGFGSLSGNNIFLGDYAGYQASNVAYSTFFGTSAGSGATNANNSNFIGYTSGINSTNASYSNFIGNGAGQSAPGASFSNFIGSSAGLGATNATQSTFIGNSAGLGATDAISSNFIGNSAGYQATNAQYASFIGFFSGNGAAAATRSTFIGTNTGFNALSSSDSVFIGYDAGRYDSGISKGSQNAANSIFIGNGAGFQTGDFTLDNTGGSTSILIGRNTSTGGYSNSIGLGEGATNTASNQFMIGSTGTPIDTVRINGSASTECTITTGTGIACTSDERVKTNIANLSADILDKVTQVRTVTYNWLGNPSGKQQIGFLAQDLEQYFPQLVETDKDGKKSVYYAQMTPILVEAVRELDLKIDTIESVANMSNQSFITRLITWLGDSLNGLTKIHVDQEVCINATCINEQDLQQFKQWQTTQGSQSAGAGGVSGGGSSSESSGDNSSGLEITTDTGSAVSENSGDTTSNPGIDSSNSDSGDASETPTGAASAPAGDTSVAGSPTDSGTADVASDTSATTE